MWFPFQGLNIRQNYVSRRTEMPRRGHSNVLSRQFSWFAGMDPLASLNGAPLAFSECASGVFSSKSKIEMTQKEQAARVSGLEFVRLG